ncbi:Acetyltransferase (GNAT) family protein [Terribacillus aidingensis]|uniref:Acetyltransferase (GNAT) family protein n=1 Tax=Terribacillus aidingensis TaxID=586416 RepID=A0A285N212_9BACI|nr:GNAT family N-acetyltransferase [Terribacillus aidingensis]SNZ03479.1 Acetyltransferase (GNAT) family protein [Terribacillus aidingensis]
MTRKTLTIDSPLIVSAAAFYQEAWQVEDATIAPRFVRHSTYPGYCGLVQLDEKGNIVGLVYGYISKQGQYYHDLLHSALQENGKSSWLEDCFEIVELAVSPTMRGKGIGTSLLTQVLAAVPNQTAILTTREKNTGAIRLYERNGWELLKDSFYPDDKAYRIYGKKLL